MNIEDLTALGITKEQAQSVKELWKKELDGNYVPKATFDAERQKIKDRDAQIIERDKQIEELGKFKGSAEDLEKKVAKLTLDNENSIKEYREKLAKMELEGAIKGELGDSVFDFSDVYGKLDTTLITVKDGKVVAGLSEQVAKLKDSHPHYFRQDNNGSNGGFKVAGSTPRTGNTLPPGNDDVEKMAIALAERKNHEDPIQKKVQEAYFGG